MRKAWEAMEAMEALEGWEAMGGLKKGRFFLEENGSFLAKIIHMWIKLLIK